MSLMQIPVDVIKFITKKMVKDADEFQAWASSFLDQDAVGVQLADRIKEHCDDLMDVLKELL